MVERHKMNNYRHGDCGLTGVKELPKGLKKLNTNVLMVGSHNNSHTFDNGDVYEVKGDDFIIGYLVAKDTTLYHPEHGEEVGKPLREAKIDDGIYEIRRQVEYTNEGMKQVID